jgi:hypothetical protein
MRKLKLWKVDIEDLSHLGGPMGTEYVTPLGSKIFRTKLEAINFIKARTKGNTTPKDIQDGDFLDCRSIGFRISEENI